MINISESENNYQAQLDAQEKLEHREYEELLVWPPLLNKQEKKMDMTQYAGNESKYLKASDLKGKTPTVTIESVSVIEFEDDDGNKIVKPACKLAGKEKELVLSSSFVEEFNKAFGTDSASWIGKSVRLSTKYYKKFGKEGIVPFPIPAQSTNEFDDDIPF